MAKGDISIVGPAAGAVPTWTWQTAAASTAINAGEPCKQTSAGSVYAAKCVDGDLTRGTDGAFLGIAASDATHTAAADGTVEIYMPLPGLVYRTKAATAANVDTQAEIDALVGDKVGWDIVAGADGAVTIDENQGNAVANALLIVGGDPDRKTLDYVIVGGALSGNQVDGA